SFQLVSVAHLPLAVGESIPFPDTTVGQQKAIEGLFGVEQVLTWRTAAVKRLDDLKLMYPSSRTAARTLKPPSFYKPPSESTDSSSPDASAQTAGGTLPGGATSPFGPAAQAITTTTLNGLELNRYTDVSPQVRHMQVAMVVVADEEHLPELLAAFAN